MRPCRATRAGTQAPPLPISIIFFPAIPHKQNNYFHAIHPQRNQSPTCNPPLPTSVIFFHTIPHKQNNHLRAIHPKRNQPSMCNPPLPISTKPRGVPLPHRGYTFDSAGLASATQPTLGNGFRQVVLPTTWVVLFLIAHHYHTRRMNDSPHAN